MRDGHAVRSIGIALALVLAITLAGCGALGGGGGGGGCGPGDTKISSVADSNSMSDQQQVSFTGKVVESARPSQDGSGGASYAIDDGTGTAFITAPPGDISEGDCVTVEGSAFANPTNAGADVIIAPSNVSQA